MRRHGIIIFCLFLMTVPLTGRAEGFASWLADFKHEAKQRGISAKAVAALDGISPDQDVIRLDRSQPEHVMSFATYRKKTLSAARIAKGKELSRRYRKLLKQAAARTGVPAQYIAALWGIETNYGRLTGNYSVLRSLATLAYEGRRAAFFRGELLAALQIIDDDHFEAGDLRGSWAGAMGQCQFMPSTFLHHAADGDGDHRRDIWNNLPDVFVSIGNYLHAEGWKSGLGWGAHVKLSRAVSSKHVGLKKSQPLAFWKKLGIKVARGSAIARHPQARYYLVQPDDAKGASYLVTDNYKVLLRWNRSTYFATSVGLLADRIQS